MRRILFLLLLLSGQASAQNDDMPAAQLLMSKGEVKILRFDEPINQVSVIIKGVVEAEPLSDRQLSIAAISQGTTRVVAFRGGRVVYDAAVTVNPVPGRIVKLYGMRDKNEDLNAGYSAMWCTETGCGRPDIDLPQPTNITIERIKNVGR